MPQALGRGVDGMIPRGIVQLVHVGQVLLQLLIIGGVLSLGMKRFA